MGGNRTDSSGAALDIVWCQGDGILGAQVTSRMEQLAADLTTLLGRYGYEPEERYFKSIRASLARAEGDPDALKDASRSILSAYRGMGSLNDLVIMAEGQVDMPANDELTLLLRELRTTAIELATDGAH